MSELSDTLPPSSTPEPAHATRPLYWSVRRELWENRAVLIAPLAVAALSLLGFVISLRHLPDQARNLGFSGAPLGMPYDIAAMALIGTSFLVSAFYALAALHGERRDRSILFWKSLPVSDLTTVASKALIPLAIIPAVTFACIVVVQLVMLVLGSLVIMASGLSAEILIANVQVAQNLVTALYGLAAMAIWLSPIWAWLMLVSAWARRVPFLWAILPPMAVGLLESMALGTRYVSSFISYRLTGGLQEAFAPSLGAYLPGSHSQTIDPLHFVTSPQTWLGVVIAAGLFAATVWVRRYKEPS